MTEEEAARADFMRLLEAGSLGTPAAKAIRAMTPRDVVERAIRRAREIESMGISEDDFRDLFVKCSSEVAELFYPKGRRIWFGLKHDPRRGEYLRDQGVLCSMLLDRLKEEGVIT